MSQHPSIIGDKRLDTPGIIGIDAGGTFTDLVYYDFTERKILKKIKEPTNHDNIIQTISEGLHALLSDINPASVQSVHLASTLATNAIVENHLAPSALLLIGYDEKDFAEYRKKESFAADQIFFLRGGHLSDGTERAPLDLQAARKIISEFDPNLRSVGISGYFSVRNADHENAVASLLKEIRPDLFVSLGHDLTTDLDAYRRAMTTSLNAGLIPVIMDLMNAVQSMCKAFHIHAPLMAVRGDGTLVNFQWAALHPVEMIMSGPAASAYGGYWLARREDLGTSTTEYKKESKKESKKEFPKGYIVADIGGTTTDIIEIDREGKPAVCSTGAVVGGHRTLIRAIDIRTFGLGGDSFVHWDKHKLVIEPRRVVPLCRAACIWPSIREQLQTEQQDFFTDQIPVFLALSNKQQTICEKSEADVPPAHSFEIEILQKLAAGPQRLRNLVDTHYLKDFFLPKIRSMEDRDMIQVIAFTPTDALHVEGKLSLWNVSAASAGAACLCGSPDLEAVRHLCHSIIDMGASKISSAILEKSLCSSGFPETESVSLRNMFSFIMEREFSQSDFSSETPEVSVPFHFCLQKNIIGAGAPAWAFIPYTAGACHTDYFIPKDSEVAGAVGAAVGTFRTEYQVDILRSEQNTKIYSPLGLATIKESDTYRASDYIKEKLVPWLLDRASKAGAIAPVAVYTKEKDAKTPDDISLIERMVIVIKEGDHQS